VLQLLQQAHSIRLMDVTLAHVIVGVAATCIIMCIRRIMGK